LIELTTLSISHNSSIITPLIDVSIVVVLFVVSSIVVFAAFVVFTVEINLEFTWFLRNSRSSGVATRQLVKNETVLGRRQVRQEGKRHHWGR
jgi:biopolymer transport protein ExbD